MTWSFYGGTIDKDKRTRENTFFAFAMAPEKLATMMDDLELKSLPAKDAAEMRRVIDLMKQKRNGTIGGKLVGAGGGGFLLLYCPKPAQVRATARSDRCRCPFSGSPH